MFLKVSSKRRYSSSFYPQVHICTVIYLQKMSTTSFPKEVLSLCMRVVLMVPLIKQLWGLLNFCCCALETSSYMRSEFNIQVFDLSARTLYVGEGNKLNVIMGELIFFWFPVIGNIVQNRPTARYRRC